MSECAGRDAYCPTYPPADVAAAIIQEWMKEWDLPLYSTRDMTLDILRDAIAQALAQRGAAERAGPPACQYDADATVEVVAEAIWREDLQEALAPDWTWSDEIAHHLWRVKAYRRSARAALSALRDGPRGG